jgi:hypothetical protein
MQVNRDRLTTVLSLIKKDDEKGWWYTSSTFDDYSSDVWLSVPSSKVEDPKLKDRLKNASYYLNAINYDLDILLNMCVQANWYKEMVLAGHLVKTDNMRYGTITADGFLIRYRSAYDTIAKAIGKVSKSPEEAPDSFTALRNKDKVDKRLKVLGPDLMGLVQNCDWYDEMVTIRDEILHHNAQTRGFAAEKILFQVMKKYTKLIKTSEVSYNENLEDFELYAGVHIAYSLWFLEQFATIAYKELPPIRYNSQPQNYHDGYGILRRWIERVLASQTR